MTRKICALLAAIALGWLVLLATPATADDGAGLGDDSVCFQENSDGELPSSCDNASGKWVAHYDGSDQSDFDSSFDDDQSTMVTIMIVVFVVFGLLAAAGVWWRMTMARTMARRSGMDEETAATMAAFGGGLETTYLVSSLRGPKPPDAPPTPAVPPSVEARLKEAERLRNEGVITFEEYEAQRKRIIDGL